MKRAKEPDTMTTAKKLGNSLYRAYKKQTERGCQDLLINWVKEVFWGRAVKDHIPVFNKIWNILYKNGHDKNNPFTWGDVDQSVWYEKPKDKTHRKVIVSESHCSCADDNIHIFVLDEYPGYDTLSKFKAVTVWQREKGKGGYKTAKGWHFWGDDRDITLPSLNTYRKRSFDFGYNDCRDKGHTFMYEFSTQRVENANWNEIKIPHSLQTLRWDLGALKECEHEK